MSQNRNTVGLPIGTVTFLFTDVEGSTRLLQELGQEEYARVLRHHHEVLRGIWADHAGAEVDTAGDGFLVVFGEARSALQAAAAAQHALEGGPLAVRVGINTGEATLEGAKYVGLSVNRAARICSAAHGGQVLVSQATAQIVGETGCIAALHLRDLGSHRLKDLPSAQPLYQLLVDGLPQEFPPLRTIGVGNVPRPVNPLIGRGEAVEELVSLLHEGTRLVTITGEGGSGKTRLALEVSNLVAGEYEDGAFFVPLAQIIDPGRVASAIAEAMGIRGTTGRDAGDALCDALRGSRTLLVLDNFEHVLEAAPLVSAIVAAGPRVIVLVTSRERLHVDGERERQLDPLSRDEAIALFLARIDSGAPDDRAVGAIVDRLDGLPLALELAAARVKLLGIEALERRLDDRFEVLRSARRDVPQRQQTLLATLEWSHELLTEEERRVLAALALFPSGCTLELAEGICGADLDTLASLVDKSLVRRRNDPGGDVRFWMLETIREFAQLHAPSELDVAELRARRLTFYRDLAEGLERELWGRGQLLALARLDREHENMLVALADGFESPGTVVDAARLAAALVDYWDIRAEFAEAHKWYERALVHGEMLPDLLRSRIWKSLAVGSARRGNRERAYELADQAWVALTGSSADREEARLLEILPNVADLGDPVQAARVTEARDRAVELAEGSDDPLAVFHALASLGQYAESSGDLDTAAEITQRLAGQLRAAGDDRNYGIMLHHQANHAARVERYEEAASLTTAALAVAEDLGDHAATSWCLQSLAEAQLGAAEFGAARETLEQAIAVNERYGMREALGPCLVTGAALAAESGAEEEAAILAGAADRHLAGPSETFPQEAWSRVEACIDRHDSEYALGRELPLDAAIDRIRDALGSGAASQ